MNENPSSTTDSSESSETALTVERMTKEVISAVNAMSAEGTINSMGELTADSRITDIDLDSLAKLDLIARVEDALSTQFPDVEDVDDLLHEKDGTIGTFAAGALEQLK